jgi:hypothetical protein
MKRGFPYEHAVVPSARTATEFAFRIILNGKEVTKGGRLRTIKELGATRSGLSCPDSYLREALRPGLMEKIGEPRTDLGDQLPGKLPCSLAGASQPA